jgi:hypothetical protein
MSFLKINKFSLNLNYKKIGNATSTGYTNIEMIKKLRGFLVWPSDTLTLTF